MSTPAHDDRLTQIKTRWSLIFQANEPGDSNVVAQQELVQRYGGAIYRYLVGMLRDPHLAEDLAQEFALRMVRGDFKQASPEKGRFRDFVKSSLRHLVIDYWRKKRPGPFPEKMVDLAVANDPKSDQAFLERWREELLERAWEMLAEIEKATGQLHYTILRFKVDHPDLRSYQIAERLGERLGKPFTETAIRKSIQRGRERFAELLIDEVARSIRSISREEIEAELGELNLLAYCQSAVDRYHQNKQ